MSMEFLKIPVVMSSKSLSAFGYQSIRIKSEVDWSPNHELGKRKYRAQPQVFNLMMRYASLLITASSCNACLVSKLEELRSSDTVLLM